MSSHDLPKPRTPKQKLRSELFPFYAGFSNDFVQDILERHERTSLVLDPWNGAGTTTSVSAALGKAAVGIDINPAMLVVAKANVATANDARLAVRLSHLIGDFTESRISPDPLTDWFSDRTSALIRGLSDHITRRSASHPVSRLPYARAILLVALFKVCRTLIRSSATTNPTWTRRPSVEVDLVNVSRKTFTKQFRQETERLVDYLSRRAFERIALPTLRIGDSRCLPISTASVDVVLTSPPYCTRIDYAVATSLELAITAPFAASKLRELRLRSIGSTAVSAQVPTPVELWGQTCKQLLREIYHHSSVGSRSYYYKTHVAYFNGLYDSLWEISRVLKNGGTATLVVQDSYYKGIHNDLAAIVSEMASNCSLNLIDRTDFAITKTILAMNNKARAYRDSTGAIEAVLTLVRS